MVLFDGHSEKNSLVVLVAGWSLSVGVDTIKVLNRKKQTSSDQNKVLHTRPRHNKGKDVFSTNTSATDS